MNFTVGATHITTITTTTINTRLGPTNHAMNTTSTGGFTTEAIVKAFSVAILIFASIVGNLVVVISFTMFRNLRSMTNYFLVSLSISDILIAICAMPFWMLVQLHEPRLFFTPDLAALTTFWKIMDIFLCLTSVYSLAAISVERNLAISQPFYYTKWVSPIRVYLTITFLWMLALTVAVITQLNPFGKKSHLSVFIVCASYFLPLVIILPMYGQILVVARRQARRLRQDGALATDLKAIKTIAIVVGTYFACYTPFMVALIYLHFQGPIASHTVSIVKWLTYLNSCLNPIIYSCFNKTYRRGFKRLFQTIAKKLHELRLRAGDNKTNAARKLQRSRLSLNLTMRSSAGSLLDGSRVPSASGQSRGSVHSLSQNAVNCVDANDNISNKSNVLKEDLVCESAENIAQDTQQ